MSEEINNLGLSDNRYVGNNEQIEIEEDFRKLKRLPYSSEFNLETSLEGLGRPFGFFRRTWKAASILEYFLGRCFNPNFMRDYRKVKDKIMEKYESYIQNLESNVQSA